MSGKEANDRRVVFFALKLFLFKLIVVESENWPVNCLMLDRDVAVSAWFPWHFSSSSPSAVSSWKSNRTETNSEHFSSKSSRLKRRTFRNLVEVLRTGLSWRWDVSGKLSPGDDDVIFMVLPQTGWLETGHDCSTKEEIYWFIYLKNVQYLKKKKTKTREALLFFFFTLKHALPWVFFKT